MVPNLFLTNLIWSTRAILINFFVFPLNCNRKPKQMHNRKMREVENGEKLVIFRGKKRKSFDVAISSS